MLLPNQYSLLAARMVEEIDQSATRIFELVQAVKEYTYMDQAAEQEIDIHAGIESTLTILAYKLQVQVHPCRTRIRSATFRRSALTVLS